MFFPFQQIPKNCATLQHESSCPSCRSVEPIYQTNCPPGQAGTICRMIYGQFIRKRCEALHLNIPCLLPSHQTTGPFPLHSFNSFLFYAPHKTLSRKWQGKWLLCKACHVNECESACWLAVRKSYQWRKMQQRYRIVQKWTQFSQRAQLGRCFGRTFLGSVVGCRSVHSQVAQGCRNEDALNYNHRHAAVVQQWCHSDQRMHWLLLCMVGRRKGVLVAPYTVC